MPLAPGTRLGSYEIVATLGAGGMGEVLRAHDKRLGRDIALKVLPDEVASSSESLARFEREARIVASLNHPNIVTLHSIEETDSTRFITMELVDGRSLADIITPEGLPIAQVLDLTIPLSDALAAVHGLLAWCHEQRYLRGGLHADARQAGLVHAHAAIETGSDDAMALAMGGFCVAVLERDYQSALEAIDRSIVLSPSSALAFGFNSIVRAWLGEDSTAIEHAKMGIRLSPYDQLVYLPYVGLTFANIFTGKFIEAISSASRAAAANPRFSVPRYLHSVALVHLGRLEEAKEMGKVVLELQPGFTISGLLATNFTRPERLQMLREALRRVGLPD